MNELAMLLKPIEPGTSFRFRKVSLILQAVDLDKRFLPLVASDVYGKAMDQFWDSAPDPASLVLMTEEERAVAMQQPIEYANSLIEKINKFIEVNDIVLTASTVRGGLVAW